MADSLIETTLSNVTKKMKVRKFSEVDHDSPTVNKKLKTEYYDDKDFKIFDSHQPQTSDDFSFILDEYQRDSSYITLDEWKYNSLDNSPVPGQFTESDNEGDPDKCSSRSSTPEIPPKLMNDDPRLRNLAEKNTPKISSALESPLINSSKDSDVIPVLSDIPDTERDGTLSILDGWPKGIEVNELFILVMSGDNKIRTLQRVSPDMDDPQLLLRVTACVSNSPLKIIVLGLERCVTNNRVYFKVTAEGQTEIEKGKKTDRIMLKESNGMNCTHLFSTDNFPNIKHMATSHIPESTYEVYIQNLITTHLTSKSRITLLQDLNTKKTYIFIEELRTKLSFKFQFPFPLKPCTSFKITMWLCDYYVDSSLHFYVGTSEFSEKEYIQCLKIHIITAVKNLRTYMTKVELRLLADLATGYVVSGPYNQYAFLEFFYRNKPEKYFQDIYNRDNGVMKPYMKDNNGDPSSVINGNIKGLFFSALLERKTLKPPYFSFFGSRRIYIYSHWMFHDDSNLYFADFYCHYDIHYVTVVLTEPGSATDQFCRERLLLLNKYNNPFIKLVDINNECKVYVTLGVHIEVLYTEPVDLYYIFNRQMGFLFEDVPTKGRGSSIPKFGIPKKADCRICNL